MPRSRDEFLPDLESSLSKGKKLSDFIGMLVRVLALTYISSIFGTIAYYAFTTGSNVPFLLGQSFLPEYARHFAAIALILGALACVQMLFVAKISTAYVGSFILPNEVDRFLPFITYIGSVLVIYIFCLVVLATFGLMGAAQGIEFVNSASSI